MTQADAHRIVHRVTRVLAKTCVPALTSDGLRQYFYALAAHFGTGATRKASANRSGTSSRRGCTVSSAR
jgi:hypothetical protein